MEEGEGGGGDGQRRDFEIEEGEGIKKRLYQHSSASLWRDEEREGEWKVIINEEHEMEEGEVVLDYKGGVD